MLKRLLFCIVWIAGMVATVTAQDGYDLKVKQYIDKYQQMAIAEQKRSGIPAAVILAQGIHETVAGTSELATMANNHFGIKCKKEWTGLTYAHTDDAPDECFRKYGSAEESYADHTDYLVKSKRYAQLFKLSVTDYAGWAFGLKRSGYATNPRYAQVLIKIVEDYRLQEFTYAAMEGASGANTVANTPGVTIPEKDAEPKMAAEKKPDVAEVTPFAPPPYGQLVRVNGLKAVYAKKGDMPLEYAIKNDIRYARLLEVNEIGERPLSTDMFLYLERKSSRGVRANHTVMKGENIMTIAQAEGVQQRALREMNLLDENDQPAEGAVLELQTMATVKPQVIEFQPIHANNTEGGVATTGAAMAASNTMPVLLGNSHSNIKVQNDASEQTKTVVSNDSVTATNANTEVKAETVAVEVKDAPEAASATTTDSNTTTQPAQESSVANIIMPSAGPSGAIAPPPPPAEEVKIEVKEVVDRSNNPPTPIETPESEKKIVKTMSGAPANVEDIPAVPKPVELVKPAPVEKVPVLTKQETVATEPETELDKLKSQFDKVVYAKNTVKEQPAETPKTEEVKEEEEVVKVAPSKDPSKFYTVRKGDTAFSIAKAHHITMRQLLDWNELNFGAIKLGQKLRIKP